MESSSVKQYIHVMVDKEGEHIKFGCEESRPVGESLFDFTEHIMSHSYFKGCDYHEHPMRAEELGELVKLQDCYREFFDETVAAGMFKAECMPKRVGSYRCIAGLGLISDDDGQLWTDYLVGGIEDCLYIEFREMLLRGLRIKRCKNCGKYFVARKSNVDYCGRSFGDDGKTCAEVGYARTFSQAVKQDELLQAYTRAYKAHYARMATPRKRSANMTREEFEAWYALAKQKLSMARRGEIGAEDFFKWLRK